MNNNYVTNNHFNTVGSHFQTQLIRYEKPLYVLVGGYIEEMYGMIIANVFEKNQKGGNNIRTLRIPLIGATMEPTDIHNENDKIICLPQNKRMTPADFRDYIDYVNPEIDIFTGLTQLKDKGFIQDIESDTLTIKVSACNNAVGLNSDWFKLDMNRPNSSWLSPKELENLCYLQMFFKKKFVFIPFNKEDEEDRVVVKQLEQLMEAFHKHNFYTNGKIINDGTYSYGSDIGRMNMTREEYLHKFPDTYPMFGNI